MACTSFFWNSEFTNEEVLPSGENEIDFEINCLNLTQTLYFVAQDFCLQDLSDYQLH